MKNKIWTYTKVVLSIVFAILFQMNIDMGVPPEESFYSIDIIFEFFLFIIFFYSFKVWQNNKNNYKRWSLIVGSVLAAFYVLGYNIEKYFDLFSQYNYDWMLGKLFLKWIVLWYCFSTLILFLYDKSDNLKYLDINEKTKQIPRPVRRLCIILIFVVCWMPALVHNYPGIVYGDSWNQIYMALGIEQLTIHHPIMHTLFLKLCFIICHDIEYGILLYTLVSFTTVILILSKVICLMIEEAFDIRIIMLAGLIYLFFPSISMFTITITKDSWFAAFVGFFLMELYVIIVNKKNDTQNSVGLIIAAIGVALFRKNGIYLLIAVSIYVSIYAFMKRVHIEKILFICLFAVSLNWGIEKASFTFFEIGQSSPREMLSLPIQQMAMIEKNVSDLNAETKQEIDSFYRKENSLGKAYYPLISDAAKNLFSESRFKNREKEFMLLSFQLFLEYPEESLEAFMCNSFGYWYPVPINWYYVENNEQLNLTETVRNHEYPHNVDYIYFNEFKNITGLILFSSLGIIFWIFIIISGYLTANREYLTLVLIIPLYALWLTSIASPVYNELRYVLAIYIAFPIICQLVIRGNTRLKSEH